MYTARGAEAAHYREDAHRRAAAKEDERHAPAVARLGGRALLMEGGVHLHTTWSETINDPQSLPCCGAQQRSHGPLAAHVATRGRPSRQGGLLWWGPSAWATVVSDNLLPWGAPPSHSYG